MAENKTRQTDRNVEEFLASVEPERRRRDGYELLRLMSDAAGMPARMWGASIVGFGRYAYRYESGHAGEWSLTGFSPRKSALTVYVMPGFKPYDDQLSRLGRHKTGASCLYLTNLEKVDKAVLADIVRDSVERMKTRYPDWSAV